MAAVLVYNACCISKLRIFLLYGDPWVPLCPDKGGLTVYSYSQGCQEGGANGALSPWPQGLEGPFRSTGNYLSVM